MNKCNCNYNFTLISRFPKSSNFNSNLIYDTELSLILIQISFRKSKKILVVQVCSKYIGSRLHYLQGMYALHARSKLRNTPTKKLKEKERMTLT